MQALVKYHGLKDWNLRIPYHDSISVNVDSLWTKTYVEFGDFDRDRVVLEGKEVTGRDYERVISVIDVVRMMSGVESKVLVLSENSLRYGSAKGLGFSSSAGAALAAAAFKAAGLDKERGWDLKAISRIARRLAGSACRSVVGGYSRWYAGEDDASSYAVRIASKEDLDVSMILVPIKAEYSTEDAHREAELSPFFRVRVRSAQERADRLERAIKEGDFRRFGELVEEDSLELHAVTMTGPSRLVLGKPETLRVIEIVKSMRKEGVPCYYSMQTGPSVFVNTLPEYSDYVASEIEERLGISTIRSGVGEGARIVG